ncbi:MAG: hypothetical protein AB7F64_04055 [Gammaproteobacteria bacterium]
MKECLFGTTEKDGKKCTWIQLESHPVGLLNLHGHMLSYARYKMTGMNQGPRSGASIHTEKSNPMIISGGHT